MYNIAQLHIGYNESVAPNTLGLNSFVYAASCRKILVHVSTLG